MRLPLASTLLAPAEYLFAFKRARVILLFRAESDEPLFPRADYLGKVKNRYVSNFGAYA